MKACQGYSLPESCHGQSNDDAVTKSATTGVASGKQLDPAFRNPHVAEATNSNASGVTTSLRYNGSMSDKDVNEAVSPWNGSGLAINAMRQADGSGLKILLRNTPELAGELCLASCVKGYLLGGVTDLSTSTIYINSDRSPVMQRTYLTHELGHYFFGYGHPQKSGDFLFGGVMQYRMNYQNQRVTDVDRAHYTEAYRKEGEVP
jgi:hypothetical protein